MASTSTYTVTKTFTRTALIKTQFRFLLSETTDASEYWLEKVIDKGIDEKWLSAVMVYAIDSDNLCHGQLDLKIDWDIHNREMAIGQATIALDSKWEKDNKELDVSPGVNAIVNVFDKFVRGGSLTTIYRFSYTDNADKDSIRKEIGSEAVELPSWKNNKAGEVRRLTRLDELTIGCYYVEDQ